MKSQPKIGKITVSAEVLETIVRLTALAVPGVTRMVHAPAMTRLRRHQGVQVGVSGNTVSAAVSIVADPQANLRRVSHQIQTEVARAIQDLVGMEVDAVDVFIEEVAPSPEIGAAQGDVTA